MSDYNFLMESRLSPEQFQVLSQLSRLAAALGLNLYLVGGAVRDLTYGQQVIRDLDFAAEGNHQKILRTLAARSSPKRRGGEAGALALDNLRDNRRLGSAEVNFSNGVRAEIGMCRGEVYRKPGRPPEVYPTTIFDDLKRRDFSVNAMAVSLHPNSRGLLLDPTNGAADIEKHELRVLSNRSFLEDPSRVFRLLRLGERLSFKPEARTANLLNGALESRVWQRLDPQQQARELRALLQEDDPGRVLKALAARGLARGLDRSLSSARIPYERFARIRSVVRSVPGADPFLLNFQCLVAKLGGALRNRLAKKVIGDRKVIKMALGLEGAARKLARALGSSKAALPSQTYALLAGQPQSLLLFLLANYRQPKIQMRVKNFLFKFPQVRARLPRAELQALGVEPGPKFEKIMEGVFFEQLDGKIKTHQQLMKHLRVLAGIKEPPKPAKRAAKVAGKAPKATKTPPKKAKKAGVKKAPNVAQRKAKPATKKKR